MSGDGFLSRWARRKALARQGVGVEADAPHPSPLPRGAGEQALRWPGHAPPAGQALDSLVEGRSSLHADRSAATPSPLIGKPAIASTSPSDKHEAPAASFTGREPEALPPSFPGREHDALAASFPSGAPEALAPSPLWGEGRGERHAPPPATAPPKTLADVASLTPSSDFQPFLSPQVDEHVKRAALKKLFADPHFNLMDGLDTYIDDYSKPDPIPESMLRRMAQSRALGLFDDDPEDAARSEPHESSALAAVESPNVASAETSPPPDAPAQAAPPGPDPEASPDGAALAELTQSATAPQAVPRHEDPDLRLQQDHAAGPGGHREGAAS